MEANLTNAIAALADLIKIDSVETPAVAGMPFGKGNADALAYALNLLDGFGFRTANIENFCGWGEVGEGELFGILGHLDVVPVGKGWTYPPFGAHIANGRMYGRGTMDDKGPVAACIFACARLLQEGKKPKKRIRFILGCDEESGWLCMDRYALTEEMPVMGFSPDSDFPVINCEKGIVYHTISLPCPKGIYSLNAGTRANVVPDFAEAVVAYDKALQDAAVANGCDCVRDGDTLRITAHGVSAHGSSPQKGVNALIALLKTLSIVYNDFLALFSGLSCWDGSCLGLNLSDEESGVLTLNLGTAKLEGGCAVFELDIRYPVTYKMEYITGVLKSSFPLYTVTQGHYHLPLFVPKDSKLVTALLDAYDSVMQTKSSPISIGGGTYARFLPLGVAFGGQFPNTPSTIHQKDEYIDLKEYEKMIEIYYAAIKSLCF